MRPGPGSATGEPPEVIAQTWISTGLVSCDERFGATSRRRWSGRVVPAATNDHGQPAPRGYQVTSQA